MFIQDIGANTKTNLDLMTSFKFCFYLSSFLLSLCIFSLIFKYFLFALNCKRLVNLKGLKKKLSRNLMNIFFKKICRLSSIGLFIVCYNIFIWLSIVIITNNMNTSMIIAAVFAGRPNSGGKMPSSKTKPIYSTNLHYYHIENYEDWMKAL